jgi:hypothetical protein
VIAGNADNFVHVKREGKERCAVVTCEFARNAEEFKPFGFTMGAEKVMTTKGLQDFLVVNGLTLVAEEDAEATSEGRKKTREQKLDELAWITALSLRKEPENLIQWSAWFELTKAHRRGKLGPGTFSATVKRLEAQGRVRKIGDLYQVVVEGDEEVPEAPRPAPEPASTSASGATFTSASPPFKGGEVPEVVVTLLEVLPKCQK